ncbi:MAG: glycosyltransferase family A protein [Acetobacteraceae bacterium]|nr:glycosyltransferase family A protein [Acetobacteraceae bacterium]
MASQPLLPVSIVVCTRNRAESLGRTLAALARLEVAPLPAVELLVVDNGSTDGTAEVVRAAQVSFPYPLRLVPCPEKGLSRARNAGVLAARHDLVLFTDDDCLPEPDWALRLAEAYGGDALQGDWRARHRSAGQMGRLRGEAAGGAFARLDQSARDGDRGRRTCLPIWSAPTSRPGVL